jgi:4-amino-4-deoxy-L-arabinose transferase-like glycosyltransferase
VSENALASHPAPRERNRLQRSPLEREKPDGREERGGPAEGADPLGHVRLGLVGSQDALSSGTAIHIFAVGLALRVAYLTISRAYLFPPDHFGFGWEAGRIASALAGGRGFSDPFVGQTGPTAWLAPAYPLILAGIFKVFGTYSALAGWVTLTFNSVCSVFTALILYALGTELFGERVGRRAGWAWALFPYAIYWPTRIVWDTSLTACLLALAFWLTLRLSRSPRADRWAFFALTWGLLALTNPVALAFALPSWGWVFVDQRRRGTLSLVRFVGALLLAVLCVAPWMLRNYRTFGEPLFIRDNFGAELRLGNGPWGLGEWMVWLHPIQDGHELARYRALGETAYVASRQREAVGFIRESFPLFLANMARRGYWFWAGTTKGEADDPLAWLRNFAFLEASLLAWAGLDLMRRERRREWVLFLLLFLLFPVVYYVTFVVTRYRHPVEPEMLLLIVYVLSAGKGERKKTRPWRPVS